MYYFEVMVNAIILTTYTGKFIDVETDMKMMTDI